MLAVVVADVEVDGDFHFERQKVGTTPADLRRLADWLVAHEVEEVVIAYASHCTSLADRAFTRAFFLALIDAQGLAKQGMPSIVDGDGLEKRGIM